MSGRPCGCDTGGAAPKMPSEDISVGSMGGPTLREAMCGGGPKGSYAGAEAAERDAAAALRAMLPAGLTVADSNGRPALASLDGCHGFGPVIGSELYLTPLGGDAPVPVPVASVTSMGVRDEREDGRLELDVATGDGRTATYLADRLAFIFGEGRSFDVNAFVTDFLRHQRIIKANGLLHIYRPSKGVYVADDEVIQSRMEALYPAIRVSQQAEALKKLRIRLSEEGRAVEPDRRYVKCGNGLYDLSEGRLVPFDPGVILFACIPHDYDPRARCDELEALLDDYASLYEDGEGGPDPMKRLLLEEIAGACLYSGIPLDAAVFLIGGGSNGKTTYVRLIQALVGRENCSAVPFQRLGDRFSAAALYGKLANICAETSDGRIPDTSVFKSLTGGDAVSAEFKGRDVFAFVSHATPVFCCNEPPEIPDTTEGMWRRVMPVRFSRRFAPDEAAKARIDAILSCE